MIILDPPGLSQILSTSVFGLPLVLQCHDVTFQDSLRSKERRQTYQVLKISPEDKS